MCVCVFVRNPQVKCVWEAGLPNLCMRPPTQPKTPPLQPDANLIPNSTRVDSFIVVNKDTSSCDLVLKTNNDAVIRCATDQ